MSILKWRLLALALLSLPIVGCADYGTGPDFGSGVEVGSVTAALTAEQCTSLGVDDWVTICHATGSTKNPYVIIRTSTEGCAEGHADHEGDYITSSDPSSPLYDPTCQGEGCLPEGAPWDESVACCEGLAPNDDGVCVYIAVCSDDGETGEVYIPPGTFTMGSPLGEVGRFNTAGRETQHAVNLTRGFLMQTTEVTQGQWKALSEGVNPSFFSNCGDCCPVERVTWYSALGYANALSGSQGLTACYTLTGCSDLTDGWKNGVHSNCSGATFHYETCTGYRLPTEAEWEYAARAGTTEATYGGNLSAMRGCVTLSGAGLFPALTPLLDLAHYWCNSASGTIAVAQKAANAWGLYDMLGNVWEWTWDRYGAYPGGVTDPLENPLGASTGSVRVRRGGSWNGSARGARAAARYGSDPSGRGNGALGFRLCRTVSP